MPAALRLSILLLLVVSEEVGAEYFVFIVVFSTALHFKEAGQPSCFVYYLSEKN